MSEPSLQMLTTGAQRLVEAAIQKQQEAGHGNLGIHHWLLALVERHGLMVDSMVNEVNAASIRARVMEQLGKGEVGQALDAQVVARMAEERARQRGRLQAAERDVATVVLLSAGYSLIAADNATKMSKVGGEAPPPVQNTLSESTSSPAPVQQPVVVKKALATPVLDQFGRDLTRAAREGKLSKVVGREDVVDLVIETLCRRTKRNPVLVGPAGVGKTAIVEALADRVVQGKTPALLSDVRVVVLQPSLLVAGAHMSGELEKRMQAIIQEASQPGVILFIDEIHTVMGAGGMMGTTDIASLLKPALARGDLACIAATTDDEYRRFIETDAALERRFQPVRVQEPSAEVTLEILKVLQVELTERYHVTVADGVLGWLLDFGQQFMRNRHFPDKAVDLLEQCYAYAVAQGKERLELADAQAVAQRMIGMPLALDARLKTLQERLDEDGLLSDEEIQLLLSRLQVTMRGLDIRSGRPNAVLMLCGEAADGSERLAETMAEALFGASDRVITIDLSRFWHAEDINLLVGAPPGYVGYSDSLPLHRLAQIPWCVVRFENSGACHPQIREVLAQAFRDGWILDGRGKPIYFSDAVVVLTADVSLETHRNLGFNTTVEKPTWDDIYDAIRKVVGTNMADQVDLFVFNISSQDEQIGSEFLQAHWLGGLADRYRKQGVLIDWDASLLDWLVKQRVVNLSEHDWERWVDHYLTPGIINYLPEVGTGAVSVIVKIVDDQIQVESLKKEERSDGVSK